jgi:hypothetical protein
VVGAALKTSARSQGSVEPGGPRPRLTVMEMAAEDGPLPRAPHANSL